MASSKADLLISVALLLSYVYGSQCVFVLEIMKHINHSRHTIVNNNVFVSSQYVPLSFLPDRLILATTAVRAQIIGHPVYVQSMF